MKALYRHVKSCTGVDNFLSECFCNDLKLMKAGRSVVTYSIQFLWLKIIKHTMYTCYFLIFVYQSMKLSEDNKANCNEYICFLQIYKKKNVQSIEHKNIK